MAALAFVWFLVSLTLILVGLLSTLMGLAYAGQAGALVALGTGFIVTIFGAKLFLAFWRRVTQGPAPKKT
ncbi:MAG: hypothetical protein LBS60_06545 [Deltaproteobacteria bacterium]|jgi:hypothetical protein|nr:hypothetical protein [Deltaproteobacteria bacterium]